MYLLFKNILHLKIDEKYTLGGKIGTFGKNNRTTETRYAKEEKS